jgi:hypothetical protein
MTRKGHNPLTPRLRRGIDIRHMTLAQYRYFRDVGLGGQLPDSQASTVFRGRAPIRNRAAADLALSTGMRPEEWSTVLLPELGAGRRRPGESVEFAVQACAKYGKYRQIYVPSAAVDAVDNFVMIERPELIVASAKSLARRRQASSMVLSASARARTGAAISRSSVRAMSNHARPSRMRPRLHSGCSDDASAKARFDVGVFQAPPESASQVVHFDFGLLETSLIVAACRCVERGCQ